MLQKIFILLTSVLTINSIYAENKLTKIGNDIYAAGNDVEVRDSNIDDVFAAANSIRVNNDIAGSAYLAGKNIVIENSIGQNLYIAAQTISLQGQTLKDINLAGKDIFVLNSVGNDLRAVANSVKIDSDVGGDLLIAAKKVEIKGNISGSVMLAVEKLIFSPDARIEGFLTLYTDGKENFEVPDYVISSDRINYKTLDKMSSYEENKSKYWFFKVFQSFSLAIIIFVIATFFREKIVSAYNRGLSNMWHSIGYGFLFLSVLIGSIIVTTITLVGIPLSILLAFATVVVWGIGYWIGNYFLICCAWQKLQKNMPSTKYSIGIASVLSAVSATVIINIPWVGWWLMLVITLFGVGSTLPWRCIKVSRNT